jgi:hypothetical protein
MAPVLKLQAPALIVVKPPQKTGTAEVQYDLFGTPPGSGVQLHWKILRRRIIFRMSPNPWHKIDLAKIVGGANFRTRGAFQLAAAIHSALTGDPGLAPGETLSLIALREDFANETLDPSTVNVERVLARISITAVLDKVKFEKPDWIHVDLKGVGGTFYLRDIAGTRDFQMLLRVSRSNPVIDPATGAFLLSNEISGGLSGLSNRRKLDISGLDPGTDYFCVVRLIDQGGNCWEFLDPQFQTLKRKLTVIWNKIDPTYVDEDEAELNVRFSIFEGSSEVGGRQYNRELVTSGQPYAVPSPNTWVMGPQTVNDSNRAIYFETEATEFDGGLFDPSELSGIKRLFIPVPVGIGEVVASTPFKMSPSNPGELEYSIEGSYQIDYI